MQKIPTAEEIKNTFRLRVRTQVNTEAEKILEGLPFGEATLLDFVSGPDETLGLNQIALREYIVKEIVNHDLRSINLTFSKKADTMSFDELAKIALDSLLVQVSEDEDPDL